MPDWRSGARLVALALASIGVLAGCNGGEDDELARFCDLAQQARAEDSVFSSFDPRDGEAAIDVFAEVRRSQGELREVAPDEVRSDLDLVIGYVEELLSGLEAHDGEGRPPVYEELLPRYDEVEAASGRLSNFVATSC